MMPKPDDDDILSLIPHREPFVQVGTLVSVSDSLFVTRTTISPENILVKSGRLMESGLLENIAQSAAAGFGYLGRKSGQKPKVGYIGAISRVEVSALPAAGDTITTHVTVLHRLDPVVMVQGACYRGDEKLLEGEIKLVI